MNKSEIINKLKKKITELKAEISNLNSLLSDSDEGSWDSKGLYEDALNGTFNGNKVAFRKPDKKFAKWIAQRYSLDEEEENE